jgi:hypothetical protein
VIRVYEQIEAVVWKGEEGWDGLVRVMVSRIGVGISGRRSVCMGMWKVFPPLCGTVSGTRACSDNVVIVLTVDAVEAIELSFLQIDISFGGEIQRGVYMQLRGDERVDESLGAGIGASVITIERSLDQRDIVRATVRRMQAHRRYGGVKTYNYAIIEIGVEEPSGAWRADSKDRSGRARAASQVFTHRRPLALPRGHVWAAPAG